MDIIRRKRKEVRAARTPRGLATDILNRIEDAKAFAEPLLDACLSSEFLPMAQDRGLITELVYGTLRMQGHLDWIIDQFHRGKATTLETGVRNILRTALYQLIYTDRVPAFAAVNEAVNLAKKDHPARVPLVNAMLRNFLRRRESLPYPDSAKEPALYISIFHSHPLWLVERWISDFGNEETRALCEANNRTPPLTVRINTLKAARETVIASLHKEGAEATPTSFSPDGLTVEKFGAPLKSLHVFQNGLIRIQDEASQLISRLAAPRPGEEVLDLCSGSGGKTTHLATIMENRGRILAVDNSPAKLDSLKDAATRLGLTIIEGLAADAANLPDRDLFNRFDLVMADVPCTGLGTLRRNPEIKWRIRPEDIRVATDLQGKILKSAASCLKTGGRLVYSTCSVMPEENENVINAFLAGHSNFTPTILTSDPAIQGLIGPEGFFRTYPHHHNMDGFFGAVLTRNA
jgi:16S rRNA (cytosine967-C5)-methyltransferase